MDWTPQQIDVLDHPLDEHAVVRAVPGAGKTTTLVGRVVRLCERGVDPARIRVVMFNREIRKTFRERLAREGISGVRVTTFDALGLEVLRKAEGAGLLSQPLEVVEDGTARWARTVFRDYAEEVEDAEEIERAVAFWKAHLVPPSRAAFPSNPALLAAYRALEGRRLDGALRVAFEDMVYTAVGVLGRSPRLLGPIDHLLVDEFQDVNPGRVELMKRLAGGGTSVMVVGDEDQGINEWCGAHPRFFRDFAQHFSWRSTRTYTLSRSFRFGGRIARAATRLIGHNATREDIAIVGGGEGEDRVALTRSAFGTIERLLAGGRKGADVAVLYRSRTQGAGVLADLAANLVPVETDDMGLLLRGRGPELALAYLRFAVDDGPVTLDEAWPVVFSPGRYVQKEAFAEQVRRHGARGLREALRSRGDEEEVAQSRTAVRAMAALAATLDRMGRCSSAAEALDVLVREVNVEAQLRARLRSEKQQEMAIVAFQAVHRLLRGLGVAPAEAASALSTLDATQGAPPDDRVWASTIHKAKGLEWPCVVLPEVIEGASPAEQRGRVPGSLEEPDGIDQSCWMEQERRIFFVGLTRARDAVYLEAPKNGASRFIDELGFRKAPKPPSTGRRWEPEEDERLRVGWQAGHPVTALSAAHGRTRSGIAARLVRLGLVETRDEARARGTAAPPTQA